jgi:hypothetical protein
MSTTAACVALPTWGVIGITIIVTIKILVGARRPVTPGRCF